MPAYTIVVELGYSCAQPVPEAQRQYNGSDASNPLVR
jgi:hypothetical protein